MTPTAHDGADVAGDGRAYGYGAALALDVAALEVVKIADQAAPFRFEADGGAAVFQLLCQHQGEQGAEDAAANGGIGGMEDQAGVEGGLGEAEKRLDPARMSR